MAEVQCAGCNGSGQIHRGYDGRRIRCPECMGRGRVSEEYANRPGGPGDIGARSSASPKRPPRDIPAEISERAGIPSDAGAPSPTSRPGMFLRRCLSGRAALQTLATLPRRFISARLGVFLRRFSSGDGQRSVGLVSLCRWAFGCICSAPGWFFGRVVSALRCTDGCPALGGAAVSRHGAGFASHLSGLVCWLPCWRWGRLRGSWSPGLGPGDFRCQTGGQDDRSFLIGCFYLLDLVPGSGKKVITVTMISLSPSL